jgi:hypothetical protein
MNNEATRTAWHVGCQSWTIGMALQGNETRSTARRVCTAGHGQHHQLT